MTRWSEENRITSDYEPHWAHEAVWTPRGREGGQSWTHDIKEFPSLKKEEHMTRPFALVS